MTGRGRVVDFLGNDWQKAWGALRAQRVMSDG